MSVTRKSAVLLLSAGALLSAIVAAEPAAAATTTGNLGVSATVTPNCRFSTVPVDFGLVDLTAETVIHGQGELVVNCTSGLDWTGVADEGQNPVGSPASRAMFNGDANKTLKYKLFVDAARTTEWTDTETDPGVFQRTGLGEADRVQIYGSIPPGQPGVPAGDYTDVVIVTLVY